MSVLDKTVQAGESFVWAPSDSLNVTDSANRQRVADGVSVAVSGDLRITQVDTSGIPTATTTIPSVAAGIVHPYRFNKVFATGTTATGVTVYFT